MLMKILTIALLFAHLSQAAFAQHSPVSSEIISAKQIAVVINPSIKETLKLTYPIRRVYHYTDKSGEYYCILTESEDSTNSDHDILHFHIRAVDVRVDTGGFQKVWECNDYIDRRTEECNMWFWTRYISFKDLDNDSLIDPVIIYGTSDRQADDDGGRLKLLIYYKGRKVAIRHQDCSLDEGRFTKVDAAFYDLPSSRQEAIEKTMKQIEDDGNSLFPGYWLKAMKNRKTEFDAGQGA